MNNSYKALRTVSTLFAMLAWFSLLVGALISIEMGRGGFAYLLMGAAVTLLVMLFQLAISQLIKLFINVADNIKRIADK